MVTILTPVTAQTLLDENFSSGFGRIFCCLAKRVDFLCINS